MGERYRFMGERYKKQGEWYICEFLKRVFKEWFYAWKRVKTALLHMLL